jgi:hypothetical protein
MAFDVASSFSSRRRLGSAVAEDQPEPDPAPEFDVDGEKRVRDGSDQVLIGIDRFAMLADCGSALHGGRFDIDFVLGPFGGSNFSA